MSQGVIQGFSGGVLSVTWKSTLEGAYLLTGSGDKFVRQWQVIGEGDEVQARLSWMSPHGKLNVRDSVLDGVKGLSEVNRALLKQRGAQERRYALSEPESTVGHRPVGATACRLS